MLRRGLALALLMAAQACRRSPPAPLTSADRQIVAAHPYADAFCTTSMLDDADSVRRGVPGHVAIDRAESDFRAYLSNATLPADDRALFYRALDANASGEDHALEQAVRDAMKTQCPSRDQSGVDYAMGLIAGMRKDGEL